MELSYFLAQLIGLTLMIFSLAVLFRPVIITGIVRDLRPDSFPMLLAGTMGIIGGLAIILSHNVWEMDWRLAITLLGWIALLKGVSYVAFPQMLRFSANQVFAREGVRMVLLIATLLLGAYLTYHGFTFGR